MQQNLVKTVLISLLVLGPLSACAQKSASESRVTATEAFEAHTKQEITLVDIRRPEEWRQTGVAVGAERINMVHPQGLQGFAQTLYDRVGQDLDAPIVLICRTGNRTGRLQPILTEMGFTNVSHVPEGMIGSRAGPGWIARGLPVDACRQC